MTILIQKEIKWKNKCGCIVDFDVLTKAVIWYSDRPVQENKSIYLHGKYAAVSIGKQKVHIHRLLMSYFFGHSIPTNLSVHHLDENKLNDSISNLAVMVSSYHNKHHMKGFHPTKEQISATIKANHKRKGTHNIKSINISDEEIKILLEEGKSINWIANYFKCNWDTIKRRVNQNMNLLEEK